MKSIVVTVVFLTWAIPFMLFMVAFLVVFFPVIGLCAWINDRENRRKESRGGPHR